MSLRLLKQLVPATARSRIRRAWTRFRHRGNHFYCPICRSRLKRFAPSGDAQDYRCPVCGSKPPHRLALHYFEQHPELFAADKLMVHIAPEPELRVWLSEWTRRVGMRYQPGGITGVGEEYLDLRQLPFADGTVDLIYCCHVLNAMQEDRAAMRELCRVLHPQGVALLQVPAFYSGATTLETNSRDERLAAFRDDGIYRCYTDADYVARLQEAGFEVEHYRAEQRSPAEIQREQLKAEVLHVCRRRGARS